MNSRDIPKALLRDGWYEVNQAGSHKQFKHPVKHGRVTLPHPKRVHTYRHIEEHREASWNQATVTPFSSGMKLWTTLPTSTKTVILISG
jgi:predicted RNA binding protein YcfA (HicA-like mRNA interferase family)